MRVTVNIDCTPEEARAFFGAPDVKPLQDAVMQNMQGQFVETMKLMDPAEAMRQWQEMNLKNFQRFQQMFWSESERGEGRETRGEERSAS